MKNILRPLPVVVLLILIDQAIKLVIKWWFLLVDTDFIPGLLGFHPVLNTDQSWIGNYIEFFSHPVVAKIMTVAALFLVVTVYLYYCSKVDRPARWPAAAFTLAFAGGLCSFIDKLFWGGSLDYIRLDGLFIFDLKDCYITASVLIFIILLLRSNPDLKLRDYFRFLAGKSKEKE